VTEVFEILRRQSAGVLVGIMGTLEVEYGDDRQLLQRSSTSWTRVQTALNPQAALPQSRRTLGRTVTIPQVHYEDAHQLRQSGYNRRANLQRLESVWWSDSLSSPLLAATK
jgi:hypothetical protein